MRPDTLSKTPRDDSRSFISAEVFMEVIITTVSFLNMTPFTLTDSNILDECDGSIFVVEVSRAGM
jgi:hypothetical protein